MNFRMIAPSHGYKQSWPIFLLSAVITIPVSAVIALEPDRYDGSVFAYIGERWADGSLPYVEVFDNKPPGIYALIALAAQSHHTLVVLAAIEFVFTMGCIISLWKIFRLSGASDRVAALGTLTVAFAVNLRIWEAGNMPECYLLWPMSTSILFFLRGVQTRKLRYLLFAGVCSGVASLFKPFGLSALIAEVSITTLWVFPLIRRILTSVIVNLVGAGIAWIPMLVYFGAHKGLMAMLDASFLYNIHYGISSQPPIVKLPAMMAHNLLPVSTMIACLVAGLVASTTRKSESCVDGHFLWTLAFLWFGAGLLLVLAAGKGYGHYFISLVPALGLAVALFLKMMDDNNVNVQLSTAICAVVLTPIFMAYMPSLTSFAYDLTTGYDGEKPIDDVAQELRRVATPSSTLFVWGYEPWLFYSTHLHNGIRYPTTIYLYDSPSSYHQAGSTILRGMATNPPEFVVVSDSNQPLTWKLGDDVVKNEFDAKLNRLYRKIWHKGLYNLYEIR